MVAMRQKTVAEYLLTIPSRPCNISYRILGQEFSISFELAKELRTYSYADYLALEIARLTRIITDAFRTLGCPAGVSSRWWVKDEPILGSTGKPKYIAALSSNFGPWVPALNADSEDSLSMQVKKDVDRIVREYAGK